MTKEKIFRIIPLVLSIILALSAFAIAIYYTVGPSAGEFHADCSDTLYWANASYESGKIISDTFSYSALLPFGGQTIMTPLIAVFGFSMTAHIVGMVIFTVIFALALYFFFRSIGFSLPYTFTSVAIVLMTFSLSAKLREMFFGHVIYYSLGVLFFALMFGLVVRILKKADAGSRRGVIVYSALAFLLSAAVATDGLQVIIIATVPVIFAVIAERFFDRDTNLFSKKNLPNALTIVVTAAASAVGFVFLKVISGKVTAGYAEGYSTYDAMTDWAENLMDLPRSFLTLIGVSINQRDPLFDGASIINILRIGFGIAVIVVPIFMLARYGKIKKRETKMLLLAHLFVSAFVLFGFIFGTLNTANWRLIPMLGTAVLATIASLHDLLSDTDAISNRLGALVLAITVIVSLVAALETANLPMASSKSRHLFRLSEYLEGNSLTYGYADYWESQAISVISGPDVKVRGIRLDEDGNVMPYYYQTDSAWYEDQAGVDKYFILLDSGDHFAYIRSDHYLEHMDNIVEETEVDDYYLIVFDVNPLEP